MESLKRGLIRGLILVLVIVVLAVIKTRFEMYVAPR
jgi:hypothetical protein